MKKLLLFTCIGLLQACQSTALIPAKPPLNACVDAAGQPKTTALEPLVRVWPKWPVEYFEPTIKGTVTLEYFVNTYGHPERVRVINSDLNAAFAEVTLNAFKYWRFQPVCEQGKVVDKRQVESFTFDNHPTPQVDTVSSKEHPHE